MSDGRTFAGFMAKLINLEPAFGQTTDIVMSSGEARKLLRRAYDAGQQNERYRSIKATGTDYLSGGSCSGSGNRND